MKLRFKVNQAECLRRGIDAPKSIVTIEVTPAEIPQAARNWIAKRMDGIDVCILNPDGTFKKGQHRDERFDAVINSNYLIVANEPTMAGLLIAVMENESESDEMPQQNKDAMKDFVVRIQGCELEAIYDKLEDHPENTAGIFIGSNAQSNPRPEWKRAGAKWIRQ